MEEKYKGLLKSPIRNDRKPLQDLLPLDQPLRVLIDPCDICNFKCSFCFQSYDKNFRGSMMSEEIFDIVVEQLKEFETPINVVHLYGLGEPMLNAKLPDFVKKLKGQGVAKEVAITSNGSRLEKYFSEKLIEAGLDRLSISLNGITDEGFERNVGNRVDFEKMYNEIKFFYHNKKNCHLHVKINDECFAEGEKDRFIELFADCSDTLNIDHVVNVWSGLQISEKDKTMYEIEDRKYTQERMVCPQMFYEIAIHSDGNVSPCCVDYNYKFQNLGNVKEKTLKEIWNGETLLTMRKQTLMGKQSCYRICNECTYPICASTVNITEEREKILSRYL